jgi:two-component system sensor histidine kinase/response regulator
MPCDIEPDAVPRQADACRVMRRFALVGLGVVVAGLLATVAGITALGWSWWTVAPAFGVVAGLLAAARSLRATLAQRFATLEQARVDALHEATRKAQFLASMSHEIRTPMNGILGMAELLVRSRLDPEQQQMAATVQASAEALLAVLNDVLDYSKMEAGKLELETVDFDVWQLLDDCAGLMHGNADQKGVELITFVDPRIGRCHRGDSSRIRQVLLNFLSNAVKFTLEGEVVASVELVDDGLTEQSIRFQVKDSGVGIAGDSLERLFAPFAQADVSTTRRFGGTGLGLAICRRLVEMMGGGIDVDSAVGKGSTFSFTLRLPRGDEAKARTRSEEVDLSRHSVLVVDHNETSRELLVMQLLPTQIGIDVASNAISGLEMLRHAARIGRPFSMAILDMAMPGVDGMALARAIRNDPSIPPLAISLTSSLGTRPALPELAEADVFRWLSKPLTANRVLEVVREMASLRRVAPIAAPATLPAAEVVEPVLDAPVLVAEDNEINRRVLAGMLRRIGYQPTFAVDGKEAVQLAQQQEFALILMDCQMPELDGYKATAAIRALGGRHRRVPILALTANALPEDRDACLRAGMDDFLTKPVKLDVLRSTARRWLARGARPAAQRS